MQEHSTKTVLQDESGATLVEFAFVAPLLVLILTGIFDLGFQTYAQAALNGAMQEAARSSTLEQNNASDATIDADITRIVHSVVPGATLSFSRKNYQSFSEVRQPEEFTDNNSNGVCDDNEPFEDMNGNGTWDQDRGRDGQGGARDAVLYTATANYDRIFPLHNLIGVPKEITIDGATVLRNQPYEDQEERAPVVENCS